MEYKIIIKVNLMGNTKLMTMMKMKNMKKMKMMKILVYTKIKKINLKS